MPHFWHLEADWTWVRRIETRIWGGRSPERPGLASPGRERGGLKCQVQKKWSATDTDRSGQPDTRAGLPLNKTCSTIQYKDCLQRYKFYFLLSKLLDNVFFTQIMYRLLPSAAVVSDRAEPCWAWKVKFRNLVKVDPRYSRYEWERVNFFLTRSGGEGDSWLDLTSVVK